MIPDFAAAPLWVLEPTLTHYDLGREQAFVHWVPFEEDRFYLLHYRPLVGTVAYTIGPAQLDAFVMDDENEEMCLTFSTARKGPGPTGEASSSRAAAAAASDAWRAIREGTFSLPEFINFTEHPSVVKLVAQTRAHPQVRSAIPSGLRVFDRSAWRFLEGASSRATK